MKILKSLIPLLLAILAGCKPNDAISAVSPDAQIVAFQSGELELHGLLYKPEGAGPFPTILYNHGSAGGLLNNQAFEAIAPIFLERGWVFFAPYRRGQGLSEDSGPYIMDEINAARRRGGLAEADKTMTRLLSTDHLDDQLAALAWLRSQPYVQSDAVAAMGNSFGGIETILGLEKGGYCAGVNAAGASQSWDRAPTIRKLLTAAAQTSTAPILFFQAENDFNIAPSQKLYEISQRSGLPSQLRIYPAFGKSKRDGHSFPYRGASIWSADVLKFLEQNCVS